MKDRLLQTKASTELVQKRRQKMREFQDYRKKKEKELAKILQSSTRQDDDEDSFQEEIIEFLVSEEIMIIDNNE
jgi:hypothetical protein